MVFSDDDPTLTPCERDALEYMIRSDRKGGFGAHKTSPVYAQCRAMLDAGRTRDDDDKDLLVRALVLSARHREPREVAA